MFHLNQTVTLRSGERAVITDVEQPVCNPVYTMLLQSGFCKGMDLRLTKREMVLNEAR